VWTFANSRNAGEKYSVRSMVGASVADMASEKW
jgi:hypothetical protein